MKNKNIEVEIRIPLEKEAFDKVRKEILKIAKFEGSSREVDEYFNPPHRDFLKPKYPFEWLRIRKRAGRFILGYKHYYPENSEEHTHCDEFETEIENSKNLKNLFASLNFRPIVKVEKKRENYVYENEFKISLDKVKGLGHFIEIEALKNFGGIEETKDKIFDFARKLGLGISKRDKRGYPYLILKKKGLIS